MSMSDQSQKSPLQIWKDLHNVTSSLESEAGVTPCNSQEFRSAPGSGRVRRRVSPSASQASNSDSLTKDTSPPPLCVSSRSAALQCSLASRLRQQLESTGSMIYSLSWKEKVTPAGRLYCQRAVSVRRTKEIGCSLGQTYWPTPDTILHQAKSKPPVMIGRKPTDPQISLADVAYHLASWPTPTTRDHKDGAECLNVPINSLLGRQVWKAAWPTPNTMDTVDRQQPRPSRAATNRTSGYLTEDVLHLKNLTQPIRITASGQILTGSDAGMESSGQLNPAHSRWLMGFPPEWDDCAATAMPSSRRVRQSLSKPSLAPQQSKKVRIRAGSFEHDGWLIGSLK